MDDSKPIWLPDMVNVNGDFDEVIENIYAIFHRDFVVDGCVFNHKLVEWDTRKLDGSPYDEGFWHIITKTDQRTGERLFDGQRAKRLPWCKPTITYSDESEVKVWRYKEASGKTNTYVWLEDWDYVIVLRERSGMVRLVTAYHIDYRLTRDNLSKKYRRRII